MLQVSAATAAHLQLRQERVHQPVKQRPKRPRQVVQCCYQRPHYLMELGAYLLRYGCEEFEVGCQQLLQPSRQAHRVSLYVRPLYAV